MTKKLKGTLKTKTEEVITHEQIEKTLWESKEKYKTIFHTSPGSVVRPKPKTNDGKPEYFFKQQKINFAFADR